MTMVNSGLKGLRSEVIGFRGIACRLYTQVCIYKVHVLLNLSFMCDVLTQYFIIYSTLITRGNRYNRAAKYNRIVNYAIKPAEDKKASKISSLPVSD